MVVQQNQLPLDRCPHCGVAAPRLEKAWQNTSLSHDNSNQRFWVVYVCATCGGHVLTGAVGTGPGPVSEMYPAGRELSDAIPKRARDFLNQAISSRHAPAGSVMLTTSAIDAMLAATGLAGDGLRERIGQAVERRLVPPEMAEWAGNAAAGEPVGEKLPDATQASRLLEFALALAEFLFVLPARVQRGLKTSARD